MEHQPLRFIKLSGLGPSMCNDLDNCWSAGENRVALAWNTDLLLYDRESIKIGTLRAPIHPGRCNLIRCAAGWEGYVAASTDECVYVWDVRMEREPIRSWCMGDQAPVRHLAFDHGDVVASQRKEFTVVNNILSTSTNLLARTFLPDFTPRERIRLTSRKAIAHRRGGKPRAPLLSCCVVPWDGENNTVFATRGRMLQIDNGQRRNALCFTYPRAYRAFVSHPLCGAHDGQPAVFTVERIQIQTRMSSHKASTLGAWRIESDVLWVQCWQASRLRFIFPVGQASELSTGKPTEDRAHLAWLDTERTLLVLLAGLELRIFRVLTDSLFLVHHQTLNAPADKLLTFPEHTEIALGALRWRTIPTCGQGVRPTLSSRTSMASNALPVVDGTLKIHLHPELFEQILNMRRLIWKNVVFQP